MPGTLLGIDIGTSSVKASLVDADSGKTLCRTQSPTSSEIPLQSPYPGWAEQNPEDWWAHTVICLQELAEHRTLANVKAVGIAYQMHGLVLVDDQGSPVRPAIIWCDSRAVESGDKLAEAVGPDYCANNLLNPPGNFTASKLAWVAENEPENIERSAAAMLPGDYIAYRLTGEIATSETGLSEMTLWDFPANTFARDLYQATTIEKDLFSRVLPTLVKRRPDSGGLRVQLGLPQDVPVTYRAGDQPNNALSLGVLKPGEAATTAGTSGVVYAVTDQNVFDPQGRVNTFLHVNHTVKEPRLGVLLCLNGCGSLYSWLRRNVLPDGSFTDLNNLAQEAPVGSEGLLVFPYGNGAERVLGNRAPGASVHGLDFNRHTRSHLARAAQEGIVFALASGLEAMQELDCPVQTVKAGRSNLFLSDLFCQTFCDVTGCRLELYETDGSVGAALGAGLGAGLFTEKIFESVPLHLANYHPHPENQSILKGAFKHWKSVQSNLLA